MIYIVPTPIGNLKDISLRALEVLESVDLIACEDTRTSSVLLNKYGIDKKLISYHMHNESKRTEEIIDLARQGEDIALISDAGMPGISDPGNRLIKKCIDQGIDYTVLPGASAFVTALVLSGFDNERFTFLGFMPSKKSDRDKVIEEIDESPYTQIIYEAPHRLMKTLVDLRDKMPDRRVAVIREISKVYEEVKIFKLSDLEDQDLVEKGEIVIVIDSYEKKLDFSDQDIKKLLREKLDQGHSKTKAVKLVSREYDLARNKVYQLSLEL